MVAFVNAAVVQKKLGRCRAIRRQARAAISESAGPAIRPSKATEPPTRYYGTNALESYVDRNVGELVDRVVAEFVERNGYDTEQHNDTNALAKRRFTFITPTKNCNTKRYVWWGRKVHWGSKVLGNEQTSK